MIRGVLAVMMRFAEVGSRYRRTEDLFSKATGSVTTAVEGVKNVLTSQGTALGEAVVGVSDELSELKRAVASLECRIATLPALVSTEVDKAFVRVCQGAIFEVTPLTEGRMEEIRNDVREGRVQLQQVETAAAA